MSTENQSEPTATATIVNGHRRIQVEQYDEHLTVRTPTDSVRLERPHEANDVGLAIQALVPKTEKRTSSDGRGSWTG